MRTVTFQSVFEAILRRHGLDPVADAIDHDTSRAIAGNINRRTRAAWESWDFSELSKTEERAFRSVWNNTRQFRRVGDDSGLPDEFYYLVDQKYYAVKPTAPSDPPMGTLPTNTTYFSELTSYEPFIDRDQPCKRALGQILGIYNDNPSLNGNSNGCLSYRPSERGVWLNGNFGKTVFVWYLLPPSQFTAVPWIEGKAYTRGERVFYIVDGNCYRCVAPTSSAAPSDANFWTMEPMPESLSDYVEAGAYADCLKEGPFNAGEVVPRMQAAATAADEAEGYLHHEIDKQLIAGERHYYVKPTWWRWSYNNGRCNGGWCNSQRWGGDRVSLLSDACETTWVYPPSPFTEIIQEVSGILSGTTELVSGQDYIDVVFGSEQPSVDWVLIQTAIFNTNDPTPLNVWPGVVTSKTTSGFRLQLNGTPDSNNYFLNWSIKAVFGYYFSGPLSGFENVDSTPFTVRLPDESSLSGTAIITPHDAGDGGTFTPTTVALTKAAPAATFTYRPASTGAKVISVTNDKGLTNPGTLPYTSVAQLHLLTNLISYWKLDEASGTRVDSKGSNDLTDNNTVGSAAGKINNGGNFIRANSEYLSHASNASLQTGDIDFSFGVWVKLASKADYGNVIAKDRYNDSREYALYYDVVNDRFVFQVTVDGTSPTQDFVRANSLGSPSTGTWYYLVAWHDSVNNTLNIQVNNGTVDSSSHTTGVFSGSAAFQLGAGLNGASPASFIDGVIDEVGFWKKVLTSDQRTALYNSGAGLPYSSFT